MPADSVMYINSSNKSTTAKPTPTTELTPAAKLDPANEANVPISPSFRMEANLNIDDANLTKCF